jgi:hypothetical protein
MMGVMEQSRRRSDQRDAPKERPAAPVVQAVPAPPEKDRRPPVTIRKISRSVDALGTRVKALERSMSELSASLERHLDELHRTMGVISLRISRLAAQQPPSPPANKEAAPAPPAPRASSPERVEELRRQVWDEPTAR